LFVSGQGSSNGHMLYEVCLSENPNTYFISSINDLNPQWLENAGSVGVCGATSTPRWLIRDIASVIEKLQPLAKP